MAEETIRYRVEVDSSDLGQQLEGIKRQIDLSMGQVAFGQAMPTANTIGGFGVEGATGGVAGAGPAAAPSAFQAATDWASQQFSQFREQANIATQQSMGDLTKFYDASRLGYQKFVNDAQMVGLMTPPGSINQLDQSRSVLPQQNSFDLGKRITEAGPFQAAMGAQFGIGYEPQGPLSLQEYKAVMQERLEEQTPGMGAGLLGGAAGFGAALKFVGGKAGPQAGLLAGLIAAPFGSDLGKGIANTLGGAGLEEAMMADYIRATSRNSTGGQFSKSESRQAAAAIKQMDTKANRLQGIDDQTIEHVIDQYTQAGGFSDAGNVDMYIAKSKELVNNYTKVMHAMHTDMSTAIATMRQLEVGAGAAGPADATNMIVRGQALASGHGISTGQMLERAQMSAEMIRGNTFMDPYGAAIGGMRMAGTVESMRESGLLGKEAMFHMGGPEGVTSLATKMAYEWGNTPGGTIAMFNQLAGGDANADISTQIQNAGTLVSDPETFLTSLYESQRQITRNGPLYNNISQGQQWLEIAANAGLGGDDGVMDPRAFQAFLVQNGMPQAEATLMTSIMQMDPGDISDQYAKESLAVIQQQMPQATTGFQRFKHSIGTPISDAYTSITGGIYDFNQMIGKSIQTNISRPLYNKMYDIDRHHGAGATLTQAEMRYINEAESLEEYQEAFDFIDQRGYGATSVGRYQTGGDQTAADIFTGRPQQAYEFYQAVTEGGHFG